VLRYTPLYSTRTPLYSACTPLVLHPYFGVLESRLFPLEYQWSLSNNTSLHSVLSSKLYPLAGSSPGWFVHSTHIPLYCYRVHIKFFLVKNKDEFLLPFCKYKIKFKLIWFKTRSHET
jgi:hypothetical protein